MRIRPRGQFLRAVTWIAGMPFALAAMPDVSGLRALLEKYPGMDRETLARVQAGQVVARLWADPGQAGALLPVPRPATVIIESISSLWL